ncbi:hypothetical protein L7F22_017234 [Adiantum nelumboides]|nr:hypothetical protein [Adiantum nelumboides]
MDGCSEKEDYHIRKFDDTNFTIWKQRMMDVLVNKGLEMPLKEHKEGVYNDDQWDELDARARATICLHLGESIFLTIMDKNTAFELWDSLCSAWDGKSASNKIFLMKKLMRLSMKECSTVSSHLNEFNSLYLQLTSKGLNFDDEMKAIFLLCSLLTSWDTFNTAISNSTHGGKLVFSDVTSALLTKEIRCATNDTPMLVNYLVTTLQLAMVNLALQGEVESRTIVDDFDFAHEGATNDTPMLVNDLATTLQQAMGNLALQGEVEEQLLHLCQFSQLPKKRECQRSLWERLPKEDSL